MVHMLYRIRKFVVSTAIIANMIGTSVLFVIVAILNGDVVARGIFNSPIRGVVEIVVFALVLIVFLQLPDVVNNGRLTRSDGLLSLLKEKNAKLSGMLSRLIDAIAGVFMLMIAWTIWPEFIEAFESCRFFETYSPEGLASHLLLAFSRCEYFGTPGIFTAPWWPARLAIFFGVTLSAIIFIFNALLGIDEPKTISKDGAAN